MITLVFSSKQYLCKDCVAYQGNALCSGNYSREKTIRGNSVIFIFSGHQGSKQQKILMQLFSQDPKEYVERRHGEPNNFLPWKLSSRLQSKVIEKSTRLLGHSYTAFCDHITLWCFGSYADMVNWELNLHESHFNKNTYFYHYYLPGLL